ncbi:unnamed protein product [Ranitomeya imitator]|uniref:Uncharacterized protein n=1 Tax=Ranitomeya imitator TaxID=111125 RepID=A0ABN9LJU5_9NEOB|nr:unnamed protein product [Ranitomeya imitator]
MIKENKLFSEEPAKHLEPETREIFEGEPAKHLEPEPREIIEEKEVLKEVPEAEKVSPSVKEEPISLDARAGQTSALLKILAALQDFQEGIARLGGDLNLSLYPRYDIATGNWWKIMSGYA